MSSCGFGQKLISLLTGSVLVIAVLCTTGAQAAELDFDFESAASEVTTSEAGMHPDFTTSFTFKHKIVEGVEKANGRVEDIEIDLPPGFAGKAAAFPRCSIGDFNALGDCPIASRSA